MISMTWPQYRRREFTLDCHVVRLSHQQIEVLSVLLMRHPHPVPIGHLIEAVWPNPDLEPDAASNQISVILIKIRRTIGYHRILRRIGLGMQLVQPGDPDWPFKPAPLLAAA